MVEQGSAISVDVSGTQVTDLPDTTGQTRDEATQTLTNAGFQVSEQTEASSRQEEGYVVNQDPKGGGGKTAEYGSTVTITVGRVPKTVNVPELYNLSPSQASQLLKGVGLSLGKQTETSSSKVPKGQIISQNPAANTKAYPGSSVDVVVSSGPNQVPVPNVVGDSLSDAESTLWNAGFAYTVEQAQSNQAAGTVISTDPAAGTPLDPYSRKVTISQSSGPPQPPPQQKQQQQRDVTESSGTSKSKNG
jgi:serine/threonine-protein kinase